VAKGPEAFRTISEAADEVSVPQHVLRFWETRFSFIRPMKRAGGRRFYRPQYIRVLHGVRRLLHDEGYSIKAVQQLHREQGLKALITANHGERPRPADSERFFDLDADGLTTADRDRLAFAMQNLQAAKRRLDALLRRN
jgi:DNA-binding transcriptional MerR regulator